VKEFQNADPLRVAVAGASGFIGKALISDLTQHDDVHVVALSRQSRSDQGPKVEARAVDFFSLYQAELGLMGCSVAIYLLHSMTPSNRLSQGSFEDFDFILADNFARAASRAGVKQIIYVGGMIAEGAPELSRHLRSRLEVEDVLGSYGIPLTSVRCSLIIGAEGSSFLILKKLVQRLPSMLLPAWCKTECQPIALQDVVLTLRAIIKKPDLTPKSYDLGAPEVMTYRGLIEEAVKASGLRRRLIDVPAVPLFLSKLWVRIVTGASRSLVYPLVDSLKHPMTVRPDHRIPTEIIDHYTPIANALKEAMLHIESRKVRINSLPRRKVRDEKLVKSVQRLQLPSGSTAYAVARLYFKWLSMFFNGLINVQLNQNTARFCLLDMNPPLLQLELSPDRSTPDRQLFYITGGVLVTPHNGARLEFRESPLGGAIFAAIHDFKPALPWWIYRISQAPFHRFVMWSFGRFLSRLGSRRQRSRST
jgi:uncharacterized protein YbjT (DUF2867 family)